MTMTDIIRWTKRQEIKRQLHSKRHRERSITVPCFNYCILKLYWQTKYRQLETDRQIQNRERGQAMSPAVSIVFKSFNDRQNTMYKETARYKDKEREVKHCPLLQVLNFKAVMSDLNSIVIRQICIQYLSKGVKIDNFISKHQSCILLEPEIIQTCTIVFIYQHVKFVSHSLSSGKKREINCKREREQEIKSD